MIGKGNGASRHKNKQKVVMTLLGQAPMEAIVFLTINERLIDLLNDDRAFIPAVKSDGETIIVAKTQIASIIEKTEDEEPLIGDTEDLSEAASTQSGKSTDDADKEPEAKDKDAQDADAEAADAEATDAKDEVAKDEDEKDAGKKDADDEKTSAKEERPKTKRTRRTRRKKTKDADDQESADKEPQFKPRKSFDPYAALHIKPEATTEEVRTAYKARMKAVHPDTVAGLGLDEELKRAALQATQRVNYAYKKILAERDETRSSSSSETEEKEDAA